MWEYVLGGATVFGLIVTLGAWINGRLTRREISRLIVEEHRATRELIEKLTKEIATRIDEGFRRMDEHFKRMDERFAKLDERFQELIRQHNELIKQHQELVRQHDEILRRISS